MHAQAGAAQDGDRTLVRAESVADPAAGPGVRAFAGAGLLLLVMVLLAIPLVVAVRSARARRQVAARAPRPTVVAPDPWSESARRLRGES